MEVGGTPQEQFANNLELQAEIKNAIKTALFNKISANHPRLAKAIAYRSIYSRLYASGDGESFYDSNGTYKTELQTYLASIKVEINNILGTLLGTGELEKILYAKCVYNFLANQPQDLFTKEPILCY
jgi:hypothetical protein